MSKKSFKKLQNRLYREIKQRMLLEQAETPIEKRQAKTVTIKVAHEIPTASYNCSAQERMECERFYGRRLDDYLVERLESEGYIRHFAVQDEQLPYVTLYSSLEVVVPENPVYTGRR